MKYRVIPDHYGGVKYVICDGCAVEVAIDPYLHPAGILPIGWNASARFDGRYHHTSAYCPACSSGRAGLHQNSVHAMEAAWWDAMTTPDISPSPCCLNDERGLPLFNQQEAA